MSKTIYALQETNRPFGPTETPFGWEIQSQHSTLNAAQKALNKAKSEMRQRCGQGAWDSHQRIIALHTHNVSFTLYCGGDNIGGWTSCPEWNERLVTVEWAKGDPMPYVPSNFTCPKCKAREEAYETKRELEYA